MSDDFQPSQHAGEANALPAELTGIYRQLERDGTAWSTHVPDTASLEDFVTTLAAGKNPQPLIDNTRKGFLPMKVTDDDIDMPMNTRPSPVTTLQRPRSFIAPIAAMLLVIMLAVGFVWRAQHHATTAPASATSAATASGLPAHATFTSSALLAGGDVWQAGIVLNGTVTAPTGGTGFVAHYTGAHWHIVDTTSFPNIALVAIAMSSDNEGWAIGQAVNSAATDHTTAPNNLYHFANSRWQKTAVALPILAISATFQFTDQNHVWLLVTDGGHSAVLHYDGTTWQTIATPESFGTIAMLSDTAGWFSGPQRLWRFQNGQFVTSYSVIGQGNKTFDGLSFTASDDGWALVSDSLFTNEGQAQAPPQTTVLHFDGTHWLPMATASQIMPSPAYYLYGLSMHTAHDGWGIIYAIAQSSKPINYATQPSYLAHYQNGTWQLLQTPTGIFFMTITMSTATDGWAVGVSYTRTGLPDESQPPVVLHYQAGTWNIVG